METIPPLLRSAGSGFRGGAGGGSFTYRHRSHSSEDEPDIQAETDRYIAFPAQALAYKLGQLKILELRERAKKDLGAKFDIRAFHDEILDGGALPLNVMDARVDGWIKAQKGGTVAGQP